LGVEPLKQLHDQVVRPIAVETTQGAWFRGWRVVSLDGSTLDVADERANEEAFGRPGAHRGKSAYPQIRFAELTQKRLKRGIFRAVLDLINAIDAYLEEHNHNPKPFIWTKTADEILEKLAPLYGVNGS